MSASMRAWTSLWSHVADALAGPHRDPERAFALAGRALLSRAIGWASGSSCTGAAAFVCAGPGADVDPFAFEDAQLALALVDTHAQGSGGVLGLRGFSDTIHGARERVLRSHPDARRGAGAVFTPAALVEDLLAQTLDRALASASTAGLTVLDPAAGSGAFLTPVFRRLVAAAIATATGGDRREVRWSAIESVLATGLRGFELDACSLEAARLALLGAAFEVLLAPDPDGSAGAGAAHDVDALLRCLTPLVCQAAMHHDALAPAGGLFAAGDDTPQRYDVVIGNPPYVDADEMSRSDPGRRDALRSRFTAAKGNWNLYCLFIERALQLTRSDGWHGFIVPNTLRAARYAQATRALLARDNTLVWLADYSQALPFDAAVYPIAYAVRRRPPGAGEPVAVWASVAGDEAPGDDRAPRAASLPYTLFTHPSRPWPITRNPEVLGPALAKLEALPLLGQLVAVRGAATVAEAYVLQAHLEECPTQAPMPGTCAVVNSGTIDPFVVRWGATPMRYLRQQWTRPVVRAEALRTLMPTRYAQTLAPKIVVAGMTRRIEAVLDLRGGLLAAKSTTVITCNELDQLCFLAALLNSAAATRVLRSLFDGLALSGGYLGLGPPQLRELPVPRFDRANPDVVALIALARELGARPWTEPPSEATLRACDVHAERLYGPEMALLGRP